MHILQPKHSKLSQKETEKLLDKLNIAKSQIPKILSSDPALPANVVVGDVIKIERDDDGKREIYYRVVI